MACYIVRASHDLYQAMTRIQFYTKRYKRASTYTLFIATKWIGYSKKILLRSGVFLPSKEDKNKIKLSLKRDQRNAYGKKDEEHTL